MTKSNLENYELSRKRNNAPDWRQNTAQMKCRICGIEMFADEKTKTRGKNTLCVYCKGKKR